jgi:hypothetical protein
MREPLPLYCAASAAYVDAVVAGKDPNTAAQRVWETEWRFDREDRDPEHQLVLGGTTSLDELLAAPPREDEHGPGWAAAESSRFGRYARRLWEPLLACEARLWR